MLDNEEIYGYHREESYDEKTVEQLKYHYGEILKLIGEDTTREGLVKTPERVAKAMLYLTNGYSQNAEQIVLSADRKSVV